MDDQAPKAPLISALLALPLLGLLLLLAVPGLDVEWQHHPSHFWIVLIAALLNVALAYSTGQAARRNHDARVFLVSMAFLAAAGFLGLHALATPGVLLDEANAGFSIATPVGLLLAGGLAAASSLPLAGESGRRVMRRSRLIEWSLIGLMVAWGIASLAGTAGLEDPTAVERASTPMLVLGVLGISLYSIAVLRYWRLFRSQRSTMLLGMIVAFVLLAEAMVAVAVSRNWHASWWEWHLLMLAAFAIVAWSAHREWHEERFGDLYTDPTGGPAEISVLFADLAGFTTLSESQAPREVTRMLNEVFEVAIPPIVKRWGGRIDRIIGDALMVTFNTAGDQPDHAQQAASAALEIQRETAALAGERPELPRFRVGVNTGSAAVGVLGTAGGRTRTVIGDAVNVASRLEGMAPTGGVAISAATADRLRGAELEPLGRVDVKGRTEPVEAYLLVGLDGPTR